MKFFPKTEILHNLDNPKQLEKLYREDASSFRKEFNQIYPGHQDNASLAFSLSFQKARLALS